MFAHGGVLSAMHIEREQGAGVGMMRWVFVLWIFLLAFGCAYLPGVMKEEHQGQVETEETVRENSVDVSEDQAAAILEDGGAVARLEDEHVSDSSMPSIMHDDRDSIIAAPRVERQETVRARRILEEERAVFGRDIYFAFDQYKLHEQMLKPLTEQADWLKVNRHAEVLIEGHCDARGSREYNIVLGERRAQAVKQFFMRSGVGAERISVISYGKERLQCRRDTEGCHAKNRRARVSLR